MRYCIVCRRSFIHCEWVEEFEELIAQADALGVASLTEDQQVALSEVICTQECLELLDGGRGVMPPAHCMGCKRSLTPEEEDHFGAFCLKCWMEEASREESFPWEEGLCPGCGEDHERGESWES